MFAVSHPSFPFAHLPVSAISPFCLLSPAHFPFIIMKLFVQILKVVPSGQVGTKGIACKGGLRIATQNGGNFENTMQHLCKSEENPPTILIFLLGKRIEIFTGVPISIYSGGN